MIKVLILIFAGVLYLVVGILMTMLLNSLVSDGDYRQSSLIHDFADQPIGNGLVIMSWPLLVAFVFVLYILAGINYMLRDCFDKLNVLQQKVDMFYLRHFKKG